ncbi:class I SAM-dependent DNA methyltransferase [Streptomyces sp. NPDC001107]
MTYDSLVNRGDYFSAHYLAEVFPKDLKAGLLTTWKDREEAARDTETAEDALPVTPRVGLRELRRPYFRARAFFAEAAAEQDDATTYDSPGWRERASELNATVLRALGYDAKPQTLTVERADHTYEVRVAHAERGLVALDCGWAAEPDAALDPDGPGRLLQRVALEGSAELATGSKLASFLFACEDAPRYVLLMVGGVVVLADRAVWGEGRYLAASLDAALERNDVRAGGELDTLAALFGADSLRTPEEGGENPLAGLVDKSTKHAVGVSSDLRDGLRLSVELIANEVLERLRAAGLRPEDVKELPELSRQLTRESLRYLYRILFLLYAEARPELGILPSDYPEYHQGYGLGRLGELVAERDLVGEKAREGFYLYESLDLLFRKVQEGYRSRRTHGAAEEAVSEDIGLRFEPLHSKLFEAESIRLIGARSVEDPRFDEDETGEVRYVDTRLRNATLYRVLRLLMLTRGKKGERGGFISYAQLGINQLGAVYEGLMSYSGFVASEELYEVAKGGDPKDGSWLVPASKADEYADSVFVRRKDEETGEEVRVRYRPGSFVYRLSGRDRQTSASYYTPESLTKVTVQLALQHRLDQDGTVTDARELLDWKICEPALGSGAFLNEAINQVAAEYLRRRQDELGVAIDTEKYAVELQKVKAYVALHNSYGVDLNSTAVELAEVSLWLNTMHPGMEAPWFGLHLRRGNSLIGGRREVYPEERLKKGGWLGATPERFPLTEVDSAGGAGLPSGAVHHFLLPAKEWGAVAAEKEAKALAPEEAKALGAWRKAITKSPSKKQTERLQGLARRLEYLWGLVVRRLEISERDISRRIDVWGAEDGWLRSPEVAVQREKVLADLEGVDTPYWRLKTLMDAWCALWFWPVQSAALLDGSSEVYRRGGVELVEEVATGDDDGVLMSWEAEALPGFGAESEQLSLTRDAVERRRAGRRKEQVPERRRAVVSLAELDDWLEFAESLLGRRDVPGDSLVSEFERLDELETYEDALPDLMGMEGAHRLEERYPWAAVARDVAGQQGFFHWELEFAQVFARGGFDLQVGNPPWVRPRWEESPVLSEITPWFSLQQGASASEIRLRKEEELQRSKPATFYLEELASTTAMQAFLGSESTYPELSGTQANLYRCFMVGSWAHVNPHGTIGLIHPDTHLSGQEEGRLRETTYKHLRLRAHFSNLMRAFPEIRVTRQFSIAIYGGPQDVEFASINWLFTGQTLTDSLTHDGTGPLPGMRHEGRYDTRPHARRFTYVNRHTLTRWSSLSAKSEAPVYQTPILYPITQAEDDAISALATFSTRLGEFNPEISDGLHETKAVREGFIRAQISHNASWEDAVLRSPSIEIGTPFAKQAPDMGRAGKPTDLRSLAPDAVPSCDFARACSPEKYRQRQDIWGGRRETEYFRMCWRERITFDTYRSLFATLIPPGTNHLNSLLSMTTTNNVTTCLNAGFWAALPMDYVLLVSGRDHLQLADARKMPAPDPKHPLASALLLRTMRLNALTNHYAPLWEELYDPTWPAYEEWAYSGWSNLQPLSVSLRPSWEYHTPLRTEYERRAALVEIDALVSVWLGITADQLTVIYRSRYPALFGYESATWFDANGRKLASDHNTYGHGQTKQDYIDLMAHLEDPKHTPPPSGYQAPFYKADREAEMRAAHAHFQSRLDAEISAGRWTP